MLVECNPSKVRSAANNARRQGATVAVVPTMGALHAGHISLVEAATSDCDFVIATIFVNPTQFAPNEDFDAYPRTLDDDLAKCQAAGVDLVFTPETSVMYDDQAQTVVSVSELTQTLEGATRPEHFDGVTTIVAKLLNICVPDVAYFGQKDFQQQLVIRRMVHDLNMGVDIVTCPIVREPDGLAMSSRNRYLSADERERALVLHRALSAAASTDGSPHAADIQAELQNTIRAQEGVDLDYAVIVDRDTLRSATTTENAVALVAARVGTTRLIDNELLN